MTRHYKRRTTRRRREEVKAILFAGFLTLVIAGCLSVSIASAGPMVLGTELNADGTVEYLCLGAGCENLAPMDW